MALENPDVIEFELVADAYALSRKSDGTVSLQDPASGRVLLPEVNGGKIAEDGTLTIQGRELGKVSGEVSGDVGALKAKLEDWFPPGDVHHAHTAEQFNNLNKSGIVVGKFSATWCGPCKAVAPAIEKLSLQYPDVTFVHMDEHEVKNLFNAEGIKSYPTFKFYMNGCKDSVGKRIEGADAQKVEARIVAMGAKKVPIQRNTTEIVAEDVTITCERDQFSIEKTEAGVRLVINGNEAAAAGKCPHMEVNRSSNKVSFGRGGGEIFLGGGADINEIGDALEALFPTHVKHVHSMEEFDAVVATGLTCAKFSADWCGPCKAIAGFYHNMSNKLEGKVEFLHIDVDEQRPLMQREGVQAMPTFIFYMDGVKKPDMTVQGANVQAVIMNLAGMGVDVSEFLKQ